ncbi:U6 snRNA phosphodiesterase 1-like isoform X2 [Corticium candelabrum]|uniref:U6 snRNA phosphodiesterase 1-like isoform X2 n=1 Tax=Corticium candelabrum TaxID=121492 RepID=UPI002E27634C|nr:U6 snRNA phosphodiesterase 1-like isoform X2 [Corticium candelabrum]
MSVSSSRCVVDYSPSDESEDDGRFTGGGADEEMREPVAKRMKTHEDSSLRIKPSVSVSSDDGARDEVMCVPDAVREMFDDGEIECDDAAQHDGRIRSFPHVTGNWATYVFAPFHTNSSFGALVTHLTDELTECLKCSDANMQRDTLAPSMNLMHAKELHISVSRTVTIRHHWIRPLIDCLQKELQSKSSFVYAFEGPRFYCNDEKTRSFLGLRVSAGRRELTGIVECVNSAFDQFALEHFYEDMDFHLSIAWWLGNILPNITDEMQHQLQSEPENGHHLIRQRLLVIQNTNTANC